MQKMIVVRMVFAVIVIAIVADSAMAQGRGRRGGITYGAGGNLQQIQEQIQEIGKQLQEGEKALKDAGEKALEARQEWQKVETEHKKNLRELAQAKKSAEEEAKNLPEMKAAREQAEAVRQEMAELRKTIVEKLTKENEEYQKAKQVHEEALEEQKANSGPKVSQETRRSLAKKVTEAEKKLRTIEDVVLADNSEAKTLNQKLKDANVEVAAAAKKKAEVIESDQRLSSAKVGFTRTRDELKQATGVRDQAEGEANRIRSQMLALVRQRQSLEAKQQQMQRAQQ